MGLPLWPLKSLVEAGLRKLTLTMTNNEDFIIGGDKDEEFMRRTRESFKEMFGADNVAVGGLTLDEYREIWRVKEQNERLRDGGTPEVSGSLSRELREAQRVVDDLRWKELGEAPRWGKGRGRKTVSISASIEAWEGMRQLARSYGFVWGSEGNVSALFEAIGLGTLRVIRASVIDVEADDEQRSMRSLEGQPTDDDYDHSKDGV